MGLPGNRQIGNGDESLWAVSSGIPGSFWFLQRQEEQGRSPSAWTIARSFSRTAGSLGLAVAVSSDASMRINSEFIAFRQSICLGEAPHRAEASETHPRKNAKTITPRAIDRERFPEKGFGMSAGANVGVKGAQRTYYSIYRCKSQPIIVEIIFDRGNLGVLGRPG
jgi:hypothetical protein